MPVLEEPLTDSQLLEDFARRKSGEASGRIVARYRDLVYSAARRQVGDAHLAEDVAQATFIVLSRKASSVRADRLAGWLLNTTRYCAANALRREGRRAGHEQQAAAGRATMTESSEASANELSSGLDEAMSRLRRRESTAVALRYLENKPMAEVAAGMGVTIHAAQKIVSRSLAKLRNALTRKGIVLSSTAALALKLGQVPVHAAPAGMGVVAAASGQSVIIARGTMQTILKMKIMIAAAAVAASVLVGSVGLAVSGQLKASEQAAPTGPTPAQAPVATAPVAPAPVAAAPVDYLSGAESPFIELVGCRIKQTVNLELTDRAHEERPVRWIDQQYFQVHWTIAALPAAKAAGYTISVAPANDPSAAQAISADKTADTQWLQDLPPKPGVYVIKMTADGADGTVVAQASAKVTVRPLPVLQIMILDYQADGTIRQTYVGQGMNTTNRVITSGGLRNDDDIHVESMLDEFGQPVKFTSVHRANMFEYRYQLNEPVPPGQPIMGAFVATENALASGVLRDIGGGVFQYSFDQHPGGPAPVGRVELHVLPAGATLIATNPEKLPDKLVNGRIQVFVDKGDIRAGGHQLVEIRYRLAGQK